MGRQRSTYYEQAVVKAFDLLEILTAEDTNQTALLLSKKLKISSNRLIKILATLEEKELIERDDKTGIYRLGLSALEMAQHILKSSCIVRLAQPIMEELA